MKTLIVATIGSVLVMSGSAFAECFNGSHAASAEPETPLVASAAESDSALLAKLKAQEAAERLEKLIVNTPAYN